jgi:hypothetical protein
MKYVPSRSALILSTIHSPKGQEWDTVFILNLADGCTLVRITKPGGRVGVIVRAIDRGCWINLPLDTALKAKVEMPGMIGGGMSPGGCADASLYQRFHALGLQELRCFPQLVAVRPGSPRLARYQQQILSALSPRETETWRRAVAQAERDGTYFIAQPFHCAVGTKPA